MVAPSRLTRKAAPGEIVMIDALHAPGGPPRFKPGMLVRAIVLARDPETQRPEVVMHRKAELAADCAVTVQEYVKGELATYRCTLAASPEEMIIAVLVGDTPWKVNVVPDAHPLVIDLINQELTVSEYTTFATLRSAVSELLGREMNP